MNDNKSFLSGIVIGLAYAKGELTDQSIITMLLNPSSNEAFLKEKSLDLINTLTSLQSERQNTQSAVQQQVKQKQVYQEDEYGDLLPDEFKQQLNKQQQNQPPSQQDQQSSQQAQQTQQAQTVQASQQQVLADDSLTLDFDIEALSQEKIDIVQPSGEQLKEMLKKQFGLED